MRNYRDCWPAGSNRVVAVAQCCFCIQTRSVKPDKQTWNHFFRRLCLCVYVHVFTLLLLRQSREWMIKKKWESRSVSSKLCRLTLVFSQNCSGVRKDFLFLYPIKQLVLFRFCVGVYCQSVQKVSAAGKLLRCCDMKCLHEKEMLQHVSWKRWGDDLTRLVVLIYSFAVEFLSLSLRLLTGWFWYLTALWLFHVKLCFLFVQNKVDF